MLELKGYDTEDYKIAIETDIGNHIRYDDNDDAFCSGFSLQNKKWFDIYLNPNGFEYIEEIVDKKDLINHLVPEMMIGLIFENGQKHAVIFLKNENNSFVFLNNRRENSEEPDLLYYNADKLINSVSDKIAVGYIADCKKINANLTEEYLISIDTWEKYKNFLIDFINEEHSEEELKRSMNSLFRPILLDGVIMAQLYKEDKLCDNLSYLQKQYIDILKENKSVKLSDYMDINLLENSINYIIERVKNKLL